MQHHNSIAAIVPDHRQHLCIAAAYLAALEHVERLRQPTTLQLIKFA
jgi:hypothetical protein